MDFQLSEMQQQIAKMIRDFGKTHIQPHVIDWDENQEFPLPLFKQLGELGLMGVLVPEQYSGSGLGYPEYVTVISEIAKFCGA
jgi:alkylation response protein AidB-like acyl-CoA dehydrogenase